MNPPLETILILTAITFSMVIFLFILFGYFAFLQPIILKSKTFLGRRKKISGVELKKQIANKLATAISELSQNKIGGLILIERKIRVKSYIDFGVPMDSIIQPQIIVALFQKTSPLHDGALIIRGDRVISVASYLPMTKKKMSSNYGSRHRAAVGASEQSDVFAIVISETNGKISYALNGKLHKIPSSDISKVIFSIITEKRGK